MLLQEMFYGTFVPPEVSQTRSHRIGFASKFRYVEPKVKEPKPKSESNPSEQVVYKAVCRAKKPMTSDDVAKKVGMTRNHCGMILHSLFQKGLVSRSKEKVGRTRLYIYTLKEKQNEIHD